MGIKRVRTNIALQNIIYIYIYIMKFLFLSPFFFLSSFFSPEKKKNKTCGTHYSKKSSLLYHASPGVLSSLYYKNKTNKYKRIVGKGWGQAQGTTWWAQES